MQALRHGEEKADLRRRLEAEGRAGDELEALLPQLEVPGRRLFNLLTLPRLDAWHLGALLALYEHRVYSDRKSTRLNSSHVAISYAICCSKKTTTPTKNPSRARAFACV